MIEGFFWVWNFLFRDFFGLENLASIYLGWLDLSRDFWGVFKAISRFVVVSVCSGHVVLWIMYNQTVITVEAFWKFLGLRNSAWDFCRLIFGPGNFLGFVGSPTEFFWVLIFAPIKSFLSLEIQSAPPGVTCSNQLRKKTHQNMYEHWCKWIVCNRLGFIHFI